MHRSEFTEFFAELPEFAAELSDLSLSLSFRNSAMQSSRITFQHFYFQGITFCIYCIVDFENKLAKLFLRSLEEFYIAPWTQEQN